MRVTALLAMASFDESRTVPRTVAVSNSANAEQAQSKAAPKACAMRRDEVLMGIVESWRGQTDSAASFTK